MEVRCRTTIYPCYCEEDRAGSQTATETRCDRQDSDSHGPRPVE